MSIAEKCLETLLTEGYTLNQISQSVNTMSDRYQDIKVVEIRLSDKEETAKKVRYYDTL